MPLLAYFVVIGSALVGLLYVAEAQLGPPKSMAVSTNFHGVPPPWKAHARIPVLTARDAPAPVVATAQTTTQSGVATQPAPATQSTVVSSQSKVEAAPTEQKPTRVAGKSKRTQKTAQKTASQKTAQQQSMDAWAFGNQQQTVQPQQKKTKSTPKTARNNGNDNRNVFAQSGTASRPAGGFIGSGLIR